MPFCSGSIYTRIFSIKGIYKIRIDATLNTKIDLFAPPFVCDLQFSAQSHLILSQQWEITSGGEGGGWSSEIPRELSTIKLQSQNYYYELQITNYFLVPYSLNFIKYLPHISLHPLSVARVTLQLTKCCICFNIQACYDEIKIP